MMPRRGLRFLRFLGLWLSFREGVVVTIVRLFGANQTTVLNTSRLLIVAYHTVKWPLEFGCV